MICTRCSASVRPIVALDIDGTMAQYHRSLMKFIEIYYDVKFTPEQYTWSGLGEFSDHLRMDKHDYRAAKLAFRAGGFKRWMPQYQGATALAQYVRELRAELWITTTRPWMRMDSADPDTREWLARNKINFDHLLYDEDKYGVLTTLVDAERIVMVLDDEAEQEERCAELGLPFTLRVNEFNTGCKAWQGSVDSLYITTAGAIIKERLDAYAERG